MKNYYEIDGDVVRIRLDRKDGSQLWTIIDVEDLEKVNSGIEGKLHASYHSHTKGFYARYHLQIDGKETTKGLHQFLFDFPENMIIDHINHNTLDNRKINLRTCTYQENNQNVRIRSDNTTGIPGVYWHKRDKIYFACIRIKENGKNILKHLGNYATIEEAIKIRKDAEIKYFKDFRYKGEV